ncbi:MAG: hypothetical protein ACT4PE_05550 [Candidatus Eiseniibacteriota bacterium]
MSSALGGAASRVAEAAQAMEPVEFGPWQGFYPSLPADLCPNDYAARDSQEYVYLPAYGYWRRRFGQTAKFSSDTAGLLPAKWSSKCRQMEEFLSESITDGIPTLIALVTKETIASGLDDGRYSNVWIRNQVNNTNYTLGSEFDSSSYPSAPATGVEQIFKFVPLWYDSGDGGLTRGTSELNRRFLVSGSRRMLRVGDWWHFPSLHGTPSRWRGNFRPTTGLAASITRNRLFPAGPISPTHSGTVAAGTPAAEGTWKGSDRFAYAVMYRYEDGSIWAPCPVRLPNDRLPDGFGIATVDAVNPAATYQSILFQGLPIGPHGVVSRIVCRGPKVDSTGPNALNISPYDLRPIYEIRDNTATEWECFDGDDATLVAPEVAERFVRHDLMMPPRSRYIFGGDMRVCHAYGGDNPAAIQIAPVSYTLANDLNTDDIGSAYTNNGSYMLFSINQTDETGSLVLIQTDNVPVVNNTVTIDLAVDDTLQKVVDRINATEIVGGGRKWRAQLCPNANPDANPLTALTPHRRTIEGCAIVLGQPRITNPTGGLSKVAIGARINVTGVGAMDAFVVTAIVSDTELTISSNATANADPVDVTFYFELGDDPVPGTTAKGYQRIIANSLPGFLYFNKTELDKSGLRKDAVWMTTADPGTNKSAANCFSRRSANRHTPPVHAGPCQGGGAVDNGFVVFWANKRGAIRNTKDSGTGLDQDYRLFITNEVSGCSSWNTIAVGNRFVAALTPGGIIAADLFNEVLISEALWSRELNETDSSYLLTPMMKNDLAATGADTDTARAHARIMRGALYFTFQATGANHPARYLAYDFSLGTESSGLSSLLRAPGRPWGWSTTLRQSFSAFVDARRDDGQHLYGWNEANSGTGDGRLDEFGTGETDNGSAISLPQLHTPWVRGAAGQRISAQEVRYEHNTPSGATLALTFFRGSAASETHAMTPASEDTSGFSDALKFLPQEQRVGTDSCKLVWAQSAGTAGQLRKLALYLKRLPFYG